MTIVANDLRATHAPKFIIESLYAEAAANGTNAVIESIRAEGEIVALREKEIFICLPWTPIRRSAMNGSSRAATKPTASPLKNSFRTKPAM